MKKTKIILFVLVLLALEFLPAEILLGQEVRYKSKAYLRAEAASESMDWEESERQYTQAAAEYFEKGDTASALLTQFKMAKSMVHQYRFAEADSLYTVIALKARDQGLNQLWGLSLNARSVILTFQDKNDALIPILEEIFTIDSLSSDIISDTHTLYGTTKYSRGEVDEARAHFIKAYEIDKQTRDSSSLPFTAADMGRALSQQGRNKEALEYYLEGVSYVRPGEEFRVVNIYFYIAELFLQNGDIIKAKSYAENCLKTLEGSKLELTKGQATSLLASVYRYLEDFVRSNELSFEALKIFEGKDAHFYRFLCHLNLANNFISLGDLDRAGEYLDWCKAYNIETGDRISGVNLHLLEARYHLAKGNNGKAFEELTAVGQARDVKKWPFLRREYHHLLSTLYQRQGDAGKALTHLKAHYDIKDSLYAIAQAHTVLELEGKYQNTLKEKEIARLSTENEIADLQIASKTRLNIIYLLSLLVALTALGLGLWAYRQKQRAKDELEVKNNALAAALKDRELLLKEIHHRVKNNLQVISSLLKLQSRYIDDTNALEAIKQGRNRVQSMALIHQNLYKEDNLTGIHINQYFTHLIENLFDSYNTDPERIKLHTDIHALCLDVDTVIPLGLIVNELVSNSLKYAFPEERQGNLYVSLKEVEGRITLEVRDDGIGFEKSNLDDQPSFGYKLVHAFKDKLEAELDIDTRAGTRVRLVIREYTKLAS